MEAKAETQEAQAPQTTESGAVEQITKVPEQVSGAPKKKDPKKVAAGKALAKTNKEAREAAAAARAKQKEDGPSFLTFDIIQKAAALVRAGLTLYHGWSAVTGELGMKFGLKTKESEPVKEALETADRAKAEEASERSKRGVASQPSQSTASRSIDMD